MDLGGDGFPVVGASYHPPGSFARHDAVVWGYAQAAARRGVALHQHVEVTGVRIEGDRCVGVDTTSGPLDAGHVVIAVAGWSSHVAAMAGVRLPIVTHLLQAFVTEPYRPVLPGPRLVDGPDDLRLADRARRAAGRRRDRPVRHVLDALDVRVPRRGREPLGPDPPVHGVGAERCGSGAASAT